MLSAGAGVRYILYKNRRLKACANSVNVASRPGRDEGAITWPCSRKGGRPPFHIDPSRISGRSKIGHWESQIGANQLKGVIETPAAGAVSQLELIPSARQRLKSTTLHCRGRPDKRAHADAPRLLLRQTAPRRACFGVALWTPPHTIQRVLEGID